MPNAMKQIKPNAKSPNHKESRIKPKIPNAEGATIFGELWLGEKGMVSDLPKVGFELTDSSVIPRLHGLIRRRFTGRAPASYGNALGRETHFSPFGGSRSSFFADRFSSASRAYRVGFGAPLSFCLYSAFSERRIFRARCSFTSECRGIASSTPVRGLIQSE
jgi:hypothetical protein